MAFLQGLVREHAPGLEFVERVANPAVFADVNEGRGLKVLVFRAGDAKPYWKSGAGG